MAGRKIVREEARRMRAEGWSLQAIADKFGASRNRVGVACAGVDCPVNHHVGGKYQALGTAASLKARIAQADHHREEAVRLRKAGLSLRKVGTLLGLSRHRVSRITAANMGNARRQKSEAVEIPSWVPAWLHEDHRTVAELEGPEAAASWCRQRKAEAAASCR